MAEPGPWKPSRRLLHVGRPQAGRTHDARAVAQSGLLAALRAGARLLVHGDRGYRGLGPITPHGGELTPAQEAENREISGIRTVVERAIAHLKAMAVLRTSIRTRSRDRERVIDETIAVWVCLAFFRQDLGKS